MGQVVTGRQDFPCHYSYESRLLTGFAAQDVVSMQSLRDRGYASITKHSFFLPVYVQTVRTPARSSVRESAR